MKIKLALFLSTMYWVAVFSQNPIIKEEHYHLIGNEWGKVSVTERSYDENYALTYQNFAYFEDRLNDWLINEEVYYDINGEVIKRIFRYYLNDKIITSESITKYNEKGQLLYKSTSEQNGVEASFLIWEEQKSTFFNEYTFVLKYYRRPAVSEALQLNSQNLYIYDEEYRFVKAIYLDKEVKNYEDYINSYEIVYENLSDGRRRRTVTYHDPVDSKSSYVLRKETFDEHGKTLFLENSFCPSCPLEVTETQYSEEQVKEIQSIYQKGDPVGSLSLSCRREVTKTPDGSILQRIQAKPFNSYTQDFLYNNLGYLMEIKSVSQQKLESGNIEESTSIKFYDYKYNCDSLPLERTESEKGIYFKTRIDYTYLFPTFCELNNTEEFSANIYPNPVDDLLTLESTYFLIEQPTFDIIDPLGRVIKKEVGQPEYIQTINTSDLLQGTYFVSFRTKNKRVSKPFVVLH